MNRKEKKAEMMKTITELETKRNTPQPVNYVALAEHCSGKLGWDDIPTLRYYRGKWYSYNDIGFEELNENEVEQDVIMSLIRNESLNVAVSLDLRKEVLAAMQTRMLCGLSAQKYHMPCMIYTREDASRTLLMANGYVSIDKILESMKAGRPRPKVKESTPGLFSTWTKGYDYVSTAKCPNFLKFLKEIQPNKSNRLALQKMAGLLLIPNSSYEKAFVFCGAAGSGKTTLLKVLKAMLGKNCYCSVPLAKMPEVSNGALLTEKLVNFSSDMSLGAEPEAVESFFKTVVSGEEIPVEQPDGTIRLANVMARCIFETNELPLFADKSNAIWDRLYPIPFNQVFRGTAKQNPHLADELIEQELSGILNWALEGLFKVLQQKTFPLTEESWNTLVDWRAECDPVGAFLMDLYTFNPDRSSCPFLMYRHFCSWKDKHGILTAVGETDFTKTVLKLFPSAFVNDKKRLQGVSYRNLWG